MDDLNIHSIIIANVRYSDGTGSKVRPALVVRFDDEIIRTFRITSQYQNKSKEIRSKYLEIIDWYKAKLKKPSWIDTVRYYDLENDGQRITIIGKLSDRDIFRLKEFIKDRDIEN